MNAAWKEDAVGEAESYVTVEVAGQAFAIPIGRVRDVFQIVGMTAVPLAPAEVAGLVNLRGRVVTAIDLRRRFGLADRAPDDPRMAVGIDDGSDAIGLVVDAVGEVVALAGRDADDLPPHLAPGWAGLCTHVHRIEGRLLMVMDVDSVLDLDRSARAA